MRLLHYFLLFLFLPATGIAQVYKSHTASKDKLIIETSQGTLSITPLSDMAIRVQLHQGLQESKDLVLVNHLPTPVFSVEETTMSLILRTKKVTAIFDKATGGLIYQDKTGTPFLSEIKGSRKLAPATIQGEPCFLAELAFDSPSQEYLFGLGQFQDGHFNLRNIPRRLIQVNTQIAMPFLYSSRGFGLLWNQYGLTDFNPADSFVVLKKLDSLTGDKKELEVTTTSGTQKISNRQSLYTGILDIPHDGEYALMLDMGAMESRHLLIIDGIPCIDQSNLWLPPAASTIVPLKAGKNDVQIVCRSSNVPTLSWKQRNDQTVFRSPHARSIDYTVFLGKAPDEIIAGFRALSGNAPLLPLWAYGFWQCRERYTSGEHLVNTVEEFRKKSLPVDVIVQDWQYWGKHGWGVPQFDSTHYPNPKQFIKRLHDLHTRFSISVWENIDQKSEVGKEYVQAGLYIPNSPWVDIYKPETRQKHWQVLKENLYDLGVDSWWMDATEPENDALAGKKTHWGPGEFYRLTYPLLVSKTVYEGQRKSDPAKRVAILTRSAFPGQQRYGTINWSGDIGWNWDAFRRQIVAGLHFSLTGMPYWTTDIGGFFRPGQGQYTDTNYHEILTRWFQWGVFNPVFRMHGYQTETEPWKYGQTVENRMRDYLNLRYRLIPYIYSESWLVTKKGSTLMRPLVMDFPTDSMAIKQKFQYQFGHSLLVAPVVEPGVSRWSVYLPSSTSWYDFWTNQVYQGGQQAIVDASLDKIPVFAKAGTILPLSNPVQFTSIKAFDTLEVRVYRGANGKFDLYLDEGDNYAYEKGAYGLIPFTWDEQQKVLRIGAASGSYRERYRKRIFHVVFIDHASANTKHKGEKRQTISYVGKPVQVRPG